MKHSPLQLQLFVIAACGFAVLVGGFFFPKPPGSDVLDLLRFALMIALLLTLSWSALRAWSKREALPAPPTPEQAGLLPRAAAFLGHPLTLTVLLAGVLASVAFATQNRAIYNDEAIWHYVGRAWLRSGLLPYTGTFENKTPGIFYLFAVSDWLAGVNFWLPRLFGILVSALTGLGIYAIGRRLAGRSVGLLALLLYGLTTADPRSMDAPFTAQTETFMLGFTVLAAWLLVATRQAASFRAHVAIIFLAGLSLGGAIAFKQTALVSLLGLLLFYLSLKAPHARTAGAVARDCLVCAAGVALATFASLVPLLLSGVSVADYLHGAWQMLGGAGSSVSSWLIRWNRLMFTLESPVLQMYMLLLGVLLLLYRRLPAAVPLVGLMGWYVCELIAVNASGTYWPHQLRQALPPLALLGGIAWWALIKANLTREPALCWPHYALIGLSIALIWTPPLGWWPLSSQSRAAREAYTWIREHTEAQDYVYTFGVMSANQILVNAERRSSSRYFTQYFLNTPGVEAEVRRDLAAKPPKYIVMESGRSLSITEDLTVPQWVDALVADAYHLEKRITYTQKTTIDDQMTSGFLIYRRNASAADKSRPAGNSAE